MYVNNILTGKGISEHEKFVCFIVNLVISANLPNDANRLQVKVYKLVL